MVAPWERTPWCSSILAISRPRDVVDDLAGHGVARLDDVPQCPEPSVEHHPGAGVGGELRTLRVGGPLQAVGERLGLGAGVLHRQVHDAVLPAPRLDLHQRADRVVSTADRRHHELELPVRDHRVEARRRVPQGTGAARARRGQRATVAPPAQQAAKRPATRSRTRRPGRRRRGGAKTGYGCGVAGLVVVLQRGPVRVGRWRRRRRWRVARPTHGRRWPGRCGAGGTTGDRAGRRLGRRLDRVR